MTDARKRILDTVDANSDKAIKFLQDIVTIPSVTGDEGKIQAFLSNYLKKIGLDVDVWESDWEALKKHPGYIPVERGYEGRPNIVATWKGTGGGRSLLLNGHTDVIPVGNGEGWSDNPWSATVKDGRIYGRGSCDMKSGVASHILAVELLKAAGIKLKGDVLINIVIDEEISGHGTLDTVIRGYTGRRRHFRRDQRACGAAGLHRPHLVRDRNPRQGRPASSGATRASAASSSVTRSPRRSRRSRPSASQPSSIRFIPKAIDALPCMIGAFHAGNFPSSFPATCLLKGSMATVPGEDHEGVKRSLVEHIAKAAAEDPWMKDHPPKVRFVGYDAQASEIPRRSSDRRRPSARTTPRSPGASRRSAGGKAPPTRASSICMAIRRP